MPQLRSTERKQVYRDYRTWSEGRWEILDGEAVAMSPAPSTGHQRLVVELGRQVATFLLGRPCEIFVAPFDVRLPETDESADETTNVLQPDLAVICDSSKIDDFGCIGAPDWIVEILSPNTAARDHVRKRRIYERHGVAEYWLVHPGDRVVTIYRRDIEGRFSMGEVIEAVGFTAVAQLPGLQIDWQMAFARFPI